MLCIKISTFFIQNLIYLLHASLEWCYRVLVVKLGNSLKIDKCLKFKMFHCFVPKFCSKNYKSKILIHSAWILMVARAGNFEKNPRPGISDETRKSGIGIGTRFLGTGNRKNGNFFYAKNFYFAKNFKFLYNKNFQFSLKSTQNSNYFMFKFA